MTTQVWFTSDTHFGHENILQFEPSRPGDGSIELHDDVLIKRFLSKMKRGDVLYHLGDVGLCHPGYLRSMLERFTSAGITLILVRGNHDRGTLRQFLSYGFRSVAEAMTLKLCKQEVLLCHYPYRWPWWRRLFKNNFTDYRKRPIDRGLFLLHGHTHSNGPRLHGRQFNVGVDVNDYYPVSLTTIEQWIQTSLNK